MTAIIQRATAPIDVIRPVEQGSLPGFSRSDREVIREVIFRDWRCQLKPAERDLISYIYAASIDRGFEVLDCTWDQLCRGVRVIGPSLTKWLIPPIGISRMTFYRLLDTLKHKSVLVVAAVHRTCTRIKINLDWAPEAGTMSPRLAISKRKQAEMNGATGCKTPSETADLEYHIGTPIYNTNINSYSPSENNLTPRSARVGPTLAIGKRKDTEVVKPISTPVTTLSLVRSIEETSKAARKQKSEHSRDKDNKAAFRSTFSVAWTETFKNLPVPGWTDQEVHMLRASLKARYPAIPDRHAFLDFVVRQWPRIIAEKFTWMTRPAPTTPHLQFLLGGRIIPTFMDAYAERSKLMASRLASPEEAQIDRLVGGGMSRDEALVKVGERRALSRVVQDRAAQQQDAGIVARQQAQIEALQKQALRDKAAARAIAPTKHLEDPSRLSIANELPEFNLPPLDPSKWTEVK